MQQIKSSSRNRNYNPRGSAIITFRFEEFLTTKSNLLSNLYYNIPWYSILFKIYYSYVLHLSTHYKPIFSVSIIYFHSTNMTKQQHLRRTTKNSHPWVYTIIIPGICKTPKRDPIYYLIYIIIFNIIRYGLIYTLYLSSNIYLSINITKQQHLRRDQTKIIF